MERAAQAGEYVAECFWAGVAEEDLEALDARMHASVHPEEGVRYRGWLLIPEDEVVFCFFEGASPETVREVAVRAAVPFERIVASTRRRGLPSAARGSVSRCGRRFACRCWGRSCSCLSPRRFLPRLPPRGRQPVKQLRSGKSPATRLRGFGTDDALLSTGSIQATIGRLERAEIAWRKDVYLGGLSVTEPSGSAAVDDLDERAPLILRGSLRRLPRR